MEKIKITKALRLTKSDLMSLNSTVRSIKQGQVNNGPSPDVAPTITLIFTNCPTCSLIHTGSGCYPNTVSACTA